MMRAAKRCILTPSAARAVLLSAFCRHLARGGRAPELSRRAHNAATDKFSMIAAPFAVGSNELFGSAYTENGHANFWSRFRSVNSRSRRFAS